MTDVTILTKKDFLIVKDPDWYVKQVILEDQLLADAMKSLGMSVERRYWDDPTLDLNQTRCAVIRAVWDYFHRYDEFESWLNRAAKETMLINPLDTIKWNIHKSYLKDLINDGVRIPVTEFIPQKSLISLVDHCEQSGWQEFVLKPAIGGAARHTYRFKRAEAKNYESIFSELNEREMWLLQEFQCSITTKGEVTHVLFDGVYSHSLIKHAKYGDFRVQDDFGGTLANYKASLSEIEFAQNAIRIVDPLPIYGRVDVIWDNTYQMCVSELELIEPELWLRLNDQAPISMAKSIRDRLSRSI